MNTSRRGLLLGLGALVAAPAIVRASSLMKVSPIAPYRTPSERWADLYLTDDNFTKNHILLAKQAMMNQKVPPFDDSYVLFAHPSEKEVLTRNYPGVRILDYEKIRAAKSRSTSAARLDIRNPRSR